MVSSFFSRAILAAAAGTASVQAVCTFTWQADPGDTCTTLAALWGITVDQFQQYNPTVKCPTLTPGVSYCVEWDYGAAPTTTKASTSTTSTTSSTTTAKPTSPTTTSTSRSTSKTTTTSTTTSPAAPSPTQDGLVSNCKSFYLVSSGDTCGAIVSKYNTFTLADFYKWNPAVGSDCTSLWVGYYVCVGIPGTPTTLTTTTKAATTAPTGPTPTQSGITSKCTNYYLVSSGDTCSNIVSKYGTFSLSDFYSWNPAVGSDCSGLWTGYYVCVGVPGTPTTTKKPTTTTAPPSGPTPTQGGIISSCNAYYQAKSGDYCQKIVDQYKTFSLQDFYKWNPAVGTDCSSLWVGYYYCVGVKK